MVSAGVSYVLTLVDGALILCAALGGAGVSTLGGSGSPESFDVDLCSNLGGALGFPGGFEKELHVVLGLPTVFLQFLQIMPYYLDVGMAPLSLQKPERRDQQKK